MEEALFHNMDYDLFYRCLAECADDIDETWFLFLDDEERGECILGYIPYIMLNNRDKQYFDKPYWIGTGSDYPRGAEFLTAKELLEDKAYGGRSIAEAWEQVCVVGFEGVELDYWFRHICSFPDEVTQVNGVWKLVK